MKKARATIIGAGAWGTALALVAADRGFSVDLYGRNPQIAADINQARENCLYLPHIILPNNIHATSDLKTAVQGSQRIFLTVPAQAVTKTVQALAGFISQQAIVICCSKGIDTQSGKFMTKLVSQYLPNNHVAVLSGPSFAADVGKRLPTAVTIAAHALPIAQLLARELSGAVLRCYSSDDVVGVELGGALKNVLAIAAGMAIGGGLGVSAQAALTTRGFTEIRRLGNAMAVRDETMMGLAVLGDLMLTCSSIKSRNFSYGVALGAGKLPEHNKLAEGVASAPMAVGLCTKFGVDAPILTTTNELLAQKITLADALHHLFARPLKNED